ncbi:hypothetical protein BP5796_02387 [Coleophoma crateriformis]|uniref:F-box domain-containing protein n=1 Tax=Coleophoma crateriformis TaxID=565419 RepID=A0A3D8SY10_9HELO|nr:hypothetical protein BP5796_02387 [Coleophoma crateriformis]
MATLIASMADASALKRKFVPELVEIERISRKAGGDRTVEHLSPEDASSLAAISAKWCLYRAQVQLQHEYASWLVTRSHASPRRRFTPELIETTRRYRKAENRAATGPSLHALPTELHFEIFSYLDNIDATCLGVTCKNAYGVYQATHANVPLTQRRVGPNKLESAWSYLGKQQCTHCGLYRCELHTHLASWVPADVEYCALKGKFGPAAAPGARSTCYRGIPSKPHVCGRHH